MRIRITFLPEEKEIEDYNLLPFQIGQVYDVAPRLAELLIMMGFAAPEMRSGEEAGNERDPYAPIK